MEVADLHQSQTLGGGAEHFGLEFDFGDAPVAEGLGRGDAARAEAEGGRGAGAAALKEEAAGGIVRRGAQQAQRQADQVAENRG